MSTYLYDLPSQMGQPTTLSRAQLAAQHPGIPYQQYINYVTRTRARRAAARTGITPGWQQALGPLSALIPPPGTLTAQAAQLYPIMSQQDMETRARAMVSAQLDPILAQMRASNEATTKAGIDRIQRYATGAATSLQQIAPEISGTYDKALQQQGALDAAFQGSMQKSGHNAAKAVGNALAAAGQSTAGANALQSLGTGAGAEELGLGGATLSQMISDQATNTSYAQKFPGYATMTGQQQIGDYTSAQQRALNDQIGSLEAQVPGITQNLLQGFIDQNTQARQGRASFLQTGQSTALQAALGMMGINTDQARIAEAWKEANLGSKTSIRTARITQAGNLAQQNAADAAAMQRLQQSLTAKYTQSGLTPQAAAVQARVVTSSLSNRVWQMRHLTENRPIMSNGLATGKTYKAATPAPRPQVYRMIANSLMTQLGITDPGTLIAQVVAIAQRGGYAAATPKEVAAVLSGTGPTKPVRKVAPTPTAGVGGAGSVTGPSQTSDLLKTAAATQQGRRMQARAFTSANASFHAGVSRQDAIERAFHLVEADLPIEVAMAVAKAAVAKAYPRQQSQAQKIKSGVPPFSFYQHA